MTPIFRSFAPLCLLGALLAVPVAAETARPTVAAAERAGRSLAARELGPDPRPIVTHRRPAEAGLTEVSNPPLRRVVPGVRPDRDAALAAEAAAPAPAAPSPGGVQFDGLAGSDNTANFGFNVLPPDTNHDVGPSHIVETTNLLVRVYDKSGAPATAPFRMSTLFLPLGGICSTHDDGDPIVLYDPLADRWLLSQFAFLTSGANRYVTHQCIAVSTSGDPAGDYHLYDFFGPNTGVFGDYPHLGVWPDGYYMTTNQFNTALNAWRGAGVFAFERERMLIGDPAAQVVYFDLLGVDDAIGGMLPADFDGLRAPPLGTPNPFAYFIATEFGDASDGLRLFDFSVDWTAPESSSFDERAESPIGVAAFSPLTPAGRDEIVQSGGTCSNALDSIADRLMHRLQYRNLGGTETLAANHTVNANGVTVCSTAGATYQAGVRLYQLSRTAGAANPFTVAQQMTHAPADGVSRWMASAATDHQNDLAVGYSVASGAVFPGIRYTGRLAGDAAGTLQTEATLIAGGGRQTSDSSRWGDYSHLAVDPADDCTFWYSQEYYAATSTGGWRTRIGNFKFSGCTPSARGGLEVTVTDCDGGSPIAGAAVTATGGYFRVADGSGVATIEPMAPGSYDVVATADGQSSASADVTVLAGQTTAIEVCIGVGGEILFADDFETGDLCEWSEQLGGPACP
ncbi:MAG TPA: carboxypeptidase-like regulatory domain-containing protein [Thermoanaerobaculia bacterium]|nr:carboxypeptidase-like regulatory domain-containing protein [Thermoanaerobaculia bacterium]